MSQAPLQKENHWLTAAAIFACLLGAAATRIGFCAFPFHGDSGLYAVMGRTVATGGVLYRDFYENKPPGVALMAALFWRCFGNWWPGYAAGEFLLTIAAAGLLARATARHAGRHTAAAAFTATIVLLNFGWVVYTGFQLETIEACLATMAAAVALDVIDPIRPIKLRSLDAGVTLRGPSRTSPLGGTDILVCHELRNRSSFSAEMDGLRSTAARDRQECLSHRGLLEHSLSEGVPGAVEGSCRGSRECSVLGAAVAVEALSATPAFNPSEARSFDCGGYAFAQDDTPERRPAGGLTTPSKSGVLLPAFLVGVLAGTAAMVKPSGAAVAAAAGFTLLIGGGAAGGIGSTALALTALALGFALPVAAVVAWIYHAGIANEMPHLFRQIALYGSQTPADWYIAVKLAIAFAFLGFPLAVRGWIFRHHDAVPLSQRRLLPNAVWTFVIAWFVFETIGIMLQGRMYLYHFLPMAPPVALAYGLLPRSNRAPAVVLGLLPAAILSVHWEGSDLAALSRSAAPAPVSQYILDHTQPGDAVFADNMGQLLMETGREPGSRYGLFYYWVNYDTAPQDYCRTMLADFDARKPAYIVLDHNVDAEMAGIFHGVILGIRPTRRTNAEHAWADFHTYLADHYRLEARVGEQNLFRRIPNAVPMARADGSE